MDALRCDLPKRVGYGPGVPTIPIRKSFLVLAGLLAGWLIIFTFSHHKTATPSSRSYQQMCLKSAHSAQNGLDMARRATSAQTGHKFNQSVMEHARGQIQSARDKVAAEPPPDSPSSQRQADLMPLLDEAMSVYDQMSNSAGGPDAAKAAEPTEQKLRDYIKQNSK